MFPNSGTVIEGPLAIKLDGVPLLDGASMVWPDCPQGETTSIGEFSVQNIGDNVVTIELTTTNLPEEFTLTWDILDYELDIDEIATGQLDLTLSLNAQPGPFSFELYLTVDDGT